VDCDADTSLVVVRAAWEVVRSGEAGAPEPRGRILIVDDDASSRGALEALLWADGFETATAANGDAALAEASRTLPDVVLADLQMPFMSGVELCRRLHEKHPELPIIIMTAHADLQSVIESLRAGAEDYLLKPMLAEVVLWCVERSLDRRAVRREAEQLRRELNDGLVLSGIREREHWKAEALQRAQLNALLENLSEGVAIADSSGRIVMLNSAARAILGFQEEIPSIDALDCLEVLDLKGQRLRSEERPLRRALSGEPFIDYEVLRIRPDGEARRVVSTGTNVKDVDGNVALAIVVFRDVTELRRLEQQRDEQLALISHDLRNPLNTVLMTLSMLKHSAEQPGAQGVVAASLKSVERAERNARRMAGMLEELTDSMKLATGNAEVRSACDLRELIVGAVDSMDDACARRISIQADAATPYVIVADPARLERVVVNLLTNALKYSADDAPVIVRLTGQGGSVALEVADRGIGIAPESLEQLFERYYRAPAGKARASGLGLGLYISRRVVEAHGGRIDVSSQVDVGSTFRVTLPLSGS
jgi:PAS domain S-box-containing protein